MVFFLHVFPMLRKLSVGFCFYLLVMRKLLFKWSLWVISSVFPLVGNAPGGSVFLREEISLFQQVMGSTRKSSVSCHFLLIQKKKCEKDGEANRKIKTIYCF